MNLICSVGSCEKERKMLLNQRLRHSSDNASVFVCCGVQLVCMCTCAHVSVCAYVYMHVVHKCAMCALYGMVVVDVDSKIFCSLSVCARVVWYI